MTLRDIQKFNILKAVQLGLGILVGIACVVQVATGANIQNAHASPRPIMTGFSNVATADDHTCAVRSGAAYCWGLNVAGGLGNGTTDAQNLAQYPVPVVTTGALAGKTVTAVGAGYQFSCALTSDGGVYCWGDNSYGQLGNGTTTPSTVPVPVTMNGALSGLTISSLSVTYHAVCVIASDSNGYCWGTNNNGELGIGVQGGMQTTPQAVATTGALAGVTLTSIATGNASTCAIGSDQASYCWGQIEGSSMPVKVNTGGLLVKMRNISVSKRVMCEVGLNASVYCMGPNSLGQIGDHTTTDAATPVQVDDSTMTNGQAIGTVSVGADDSVCAQSFTGRIFCWGRNDAGGVQGSGILGSFALTSDYSTQPVANDAFMNPSISDNAQSIANSGSGSKCSVTAAGAILCWGGTQGRGNGLVENANRPAIATYVSQPGPDITQIDVSSAYIGLGDVQATITGHDFNATTTAYIGTVQAQVTAWTATSLSVTIPTSTAQPGVVDIKVTNGDGLIGTQAQAFEFKLYTPSIDQIAPRLVPIDGASHAVTITGSHFQDGAVVKIDNTVVPSTRVSDTELTANVPTTGETVIRDADVTVLNPNGQSTVLQQGLTFATFSVVNIAPNSAVADGTQQAEIIGYLFQPGATVKLGTTPVTVTYQDDRDIQFIVPAMTVTQPLTVDVTVTNPDGTTTVVPNGFTYEPTPVTAITGVAFSQDTAINTVLTISGQNLADLYSQSGALYSLGYMTLNGIAVPFCSTNLGPDAATVAGNFGIPVDHVSDTPPCFLLVNANSTVAVTDTQVQIILPSNFDQTAPFTVSVRGVSFNANAVVDVSTGGATAGGTASTNGTTSSGSAAPRGQKQTTSVSSGSTDSASTTGLTTSVTQSVVPTLLSNSQTIKNGTVIAATPTFSGLATPYSKVTVTVHSDPITCSATADAVGMWSCTLPATLPAGTHTVKVAVTTPDGTTMELGPYTVKVNAATPTKVSGVVTQKPTYMFWLIVSAAGLIIFAIIAALIARSRRKARHTS